MKPCELVVSLMLIWTCSLAPLAAQQKRGARPRRESGSAAREIFSGEIMEIRDGKIALRPWNPDLPRRVEVSVPPATRCFRQSRGETRDVAIGDLVTVVPEEPESGKDRLLGKAPAKPHASEDGKPKKAEAVLRFWRSENAELAPEQRELIRQLLTASMPFFRGTKKGSVTRPSKETHGLTGVVIGREPFTVATEKRGHPFALPGDALVILHDTMPTTDLRRGQTVSVAGEPAPAPGATVEAKLLVVGPKPDLGAKQMRQFILREQGRGDH